MDLPPGTYVQVYRNLNRACWSVRLRGKVIGHVSTMTLQDVTLIIQQAGQTRVRVTGQKNVHAYARGKLGQADAATAATLRTRYDPRTRNTFQLENGTPVHACAIATFDLQGRMFVAPGVFETPLVFGTTCQAKSPSSDSHVSSPSCHVL